MAEFKYEIVERIAVLSQSANGWERQLNLISWNDREPQVRHSRLGAGWGPRWARESPFPAMSLRFSRESLRKWKFDYGLQRRIYPDL